MVAGRLWFVLVADLLLAAVEVADAEGEQDGVGDPCHGAVAEG